MRKTALWLLMLSSMFCSEALADQITLKNGDRLTGAIIKFDGEKLKIKSEFAGEVQVPWAAIDKVTSDQPLYVTSTDGRVLIGTLTTTEKGIEVQTGQAGTVALSKEAIHLIRSKVNKRPTKLNWLGKVKHCGVVRQTPGSALHVVIRIL